MEFLLKFFLTATAVVVIILVMLQRGKGGGLAGALGGMGGQSAFGTKAGDLFTKITVGVAAFWILISIFAAIYAARLSGDQLGSTQTINAQQNPGPAPVAPAGGKPVEPDKGAKPAGKLPEKSAEKPTASSPAAPTPTAPTATPPAAPPAKAPAK